MIVQAFSAFFKTNMTLLMLAEKSAFSRIVYSIARHLFSLSRGLESASAAIKINAFRRRV